MNHSIFAYVVLALLSISPVKVVAFNFCENYIFTSPYYDSTNKGFVSQKTPSTFTSIYPSTKDKSLVSSAASCSSTYMNTFDWSIQASYLNCKSLTEFGLGFWVYFESTLGNNIIVIGDSQFGYQNSYIVNSAVEGSITFSYYVGSQHDNDVFGVSVPLSNHYLDTWTFLGFHWKDNTMDVSIPGQNLISTPHISNGWTTFRPPSTDGIIYFGKSMKAKIYQILGFNKFAEYQNNKEIILSDGTDSYTATQTCTGTCTDTICHPSQRCLSMTSYCATCDSTGCLTCTTNAAYVSYYCNNICPTNCAKCSSATKCDQCDHNYFLYNNAGQVSCSSCADSCSFCSSTPVCYKCANTVLQSGATCEMVSIGYQLSWANPNIKITFSSPIANALTVKNFVAQNSAGTPIVTTGWVLNTCASGSSSCTIATDNVTPDLLPITLNLEFTQ